MAEPLAPRAAPSPSSWSVTPRARRARLWCGVAGLAFVAAACATLEAPSMSLFGSMTDASPSRADHSLPAIPPAASRYRTFLMQAWQYHFAMAEDPAIGFGQIHQESRFDCTAISPGGSRGCAQFMPATAEWINNLIPAEVRARCPSTAGCPMDPRWALTALVEYDWRLWTAGTWAASGRERWAFTLAAYNGGSAVSGGERTACAQSRGCDPARYFGHVERFCGATGRSAASCRENRQYPRVILDRWTPLYHTWLRG
jgi:soluble lytic murein transglycosylase-like protein